MNQLNLNELDLSILKAIYDQAIAQQCLSGIPSQIISCKFVKEQQITFDIFKESFDILCLKKLITGDPASICSITNYGLQVCIDKYMDQEEYNKLEKKIICALINLKINSLDEINPIYKVYILSDLRDRKLLHVTYFVGGGLEIQNISPDLKKYAHEIGLDCAS